VNEVDQGRPVVVIYTHSLLEGSMTFIKSQAEALTEYKPVYAGSRRVAGIQLPDSRTYAVNTGTTLGIVFEGLFRKWGWAPGLLRALQTYEPKVVHTHFGDCAAAGMVLAEHLGTPLVVTFHGRDATQSQEAMLRSHRGREVLRKKQRLIERTSVFIAVSDYIRSRLLEQGYPASKVLVHRNGIDLDFFDPHQDAPRKPVILFVGRFVEKKGAAYLIEAARLLKLNGVAFELVMIGAGPLESELKADARKYEIPCQFTGFLSPNEIKEWLQIASVVAVPSVTARDGDSEGLPTILLEAQAMMTPVVATFHSGIPEGVRNGVTAELVKERDALALAEKLQSLLLNPSRAREFGAAGRHFVTECFDMHKQVAGLEKIYDDARGRHFG
jgi:colanic acid/amylovoran biosynthesis glycosyltransferase